MTADQWQQAKDAIAARRALVEAGTGGVWHAYHGPGGYPNQVRTHPEPDKGLPVLFDGSGVTLGSAHYMRGEDAELIVAAVNDYPLLLDIAEGVLDQHKSHGSLGRCSGCGNLSPCSDVGPVLDWLGVA